MESLACRTVCGKIILEFKELVRKYILPDLMKSWKKLKFFYKISIAHNFC